MVSLLLGASLLFACTASSSAGQKDKKKKNASNPADNKPVIPLGDEQQIDYLISEMLGAWQIGDTEKMHKDYADDVIVVNGTWAPPVITWANYLAVYQQQRAHATSAHGSRKHVYESDRQFCVGLLPVGFFSGGRWAAYRRPRAHDADPGKEE